MLEFQTVRALQVVCRRLGDAAGGTPGKSYLTNIIFRFLIISEDKKIGFQHREPHKEGEAAWGPQAVLGGPWGYQRPLGAQGGPSGPLGLL